MMIDKRHIVIAEKICKDNVIKRYRHKHVCKDCKGSANMGLDTKGQVYPCKVCTNLPGVYRDWFTYVKTQEDLRTLLIDELKKRYPEDYIKPKDQKVKMVTK